MKGKIDRLRITLRLIHATKLILCELRTFRVQYRKSFRRMNGRRSKTSPVFDFLQLIFYIFFFSLFLPQNTKHYSFSIQQTNLSTDEHDQPIKSMNHLSLLNTWRWMLFSNVLSCACCCCSLFIFLFSIILHLFPFNVSLWCVNFSKCQAYIIPILCIFSVGMFGKYKMWKKDEKIHPKTGDNSWLICHVTNWKMILSPKDDYMKVTIHNWEIRKENSWLFFLCGIKKKSKISRKQLFEQRKQFDEFFSIWIRCASYNLRLLNV